MGRFAKPVALRLEIDSFFEWLDFLKVLPGSSGFYFERLLECLCFSIDPFGEIFSLPLDNLV
jgi:hypothetical protein